MCPLDISNPFHIAGLDPLRDAYASYALAPLSILAVLLPTIALVARYRRSRGVEHQQLKWFASSGVFVALGSILISVDLVSFGEYRHEDSPTFRSPPRCQGDVAQALDAEVFGEDQQPYVDVVLEPS